MGYGVLRYARATKHRVAPMRRLVPKTDHGQAPGDLPSAWPGWRL